MFYQIIGRHTKPSLIGSQSNFLSVLVVLIKQALLLGSNEPIARDHPRHICCSQMEAALCFVKEVQSKHGVVSIGDLTKNTDVIGKCQLSSLLVRCGSKCCRGES